MASPKTDLNGDTEHKVYNVAFGSDDIYTMKDMRERLTWSYQMHMISYDPDIFIHSALTKYLYSNYNQYLNILDRESPIWSAYVGDISKKTILDDIYIDDMADDITYSSINNTGLVKINSSSMLFPKGNYDGYALI